MSTALERPRPLLAIGALTLLLVAALVGLSLRTDSRVNRETLAASPKEVATSSARAQRYRPSRRYVATVAPWLEARVGTQFTSAYVDTVLVRPGAAVHRGQVLATLDCRTASAQSRALAQQARALSATEEAIAKETSRVSGLLEGGYVSPNEVERRTAESASKQAERLAAEARLSRAALEVNDCVLRAPFDGEVADRALDPGAFARPGVPLLTLVDRTRVRVLLDVPESDYAVVAPETAVRLRLLATGATLTGTIARRAPGADPGTRTIHAEVDLVDPERRVPVGTTAEATIDVGQPTDAIAVPLRAATVRGDKATLYVVAEGKAQKRQATVLGESGADLFLAPGLAPGAAVVVEGRGLLQDGDAVLARPETSSILPPGGAR